VVTRYVILFLLIWIVALIGVNVFSRLGKKSVVSLVDEKLEEPIIEQKEDVVYLEDKKGSPIFESKADRQYLGEDGFYHLEGNVLVKFLKRAEGDDIVFNGDEIRYDREGNRFILLGDAEIRFKDLVIESSYLEYGSQTHMIKTEKGVSFSSPRIRGQGQTLVCFEKKQEVEIQNNVHIELIRENEGSKVIYVSGDKMFYTHKWGNGSMEGHVKLKAGQNSVKADRLEFYLPPNKDFLRSLILKGNIKGDLFSGLSPENQGEVEEYKAEAEEVFIRFFKYLDVPQRVEAQGHCLIDTSQSGIGIQSIQSEKFMIYFSRNGEISGFSGLEGVLIKERKGDGGREIKGNRFEIGQNKEILRVFGKGSQRAEIASGDYNISADEITSPLRGGDLEAKGEVKGVFMSSPSSYVDMGLFSHSQPVFISTETMRYIEEEKRFIFRDQVKLWQEKEMIVAEEVVMEKERGGMNAHHGVQTVLHYEKEGKEQRFHISSHVMEFDPQKNIILFEQECVMEIGGVKLNADSISILMEENENEMKFLTAKDSVIIEMGTYEGRGGRADFIFADEMLVLTENPVLIEKDQGTTEGDKLTFRLADDRIFIENEGDRRSVTILKK